MRPPRAASSMTNILLFCTALALAGCSDNQPVSPGVEPQVINNTDTFEFQVSSVENYSAVWRYDWTTTGTIVNVDQSCAITAGTATLSIVDSDGQTVYSRDLSEDGSFSTDTGVTGQWSLEVALSGTSGTLNFRTEKNQ